MNRLRHNATFWLLGLTFAASLSIGALKSKPSPDFPDSGALLDVSGWNFRKPVEVVRPGAQQVELDLGVLSHAQSHFEDLRLMRDGEQVPYVIDRTSSERALTPSVTVTNDAHDLKSSRWALKLPNAAPPVTRLVCTSQTPLFQRDITAYEELHDADRGEIYQRPLGHASWTQTPGVAKKEFTLKLDFPPQSDTIILETQNGDNPPIALDNIRFFYPVTRLLFKAKSNDALALYYGNSEVSAPHYDLSLVANELLAADKAAASLGAEERLNKATYYVANASGKGGVLFWGILALVVVALLVLIARLLPKSNTQPPK